MAYLERYASSADNLRRVLRRKVDQRCRLRGEDSADFYEAVDEVVACAPAVLNHRLVLAYEASLEKVVTTDVIRALLQAVPEVPRA